MCYTQSIANICIRNTCSDSISKFRATVITSLIVAVQFSNFPSHIRFLLQNLQQRNGRRVGRGGGEGVILLIYVALIIAAPKFIRSSKLGAGKRKGVEGGEGLYSAHKFLKSDMSKSHRHAAPRFR